MAFVINNDGLTGAASAYGSLETRYAKAKKDLYDGISALENSWTDSAGDAFQTIKTKMNTELGKQEANIGSNAGLLNDISSVASATQAKVRSEISRMM